MYHSEIILDENSTYKFMSFYQKILDLLNINNDIYTAILFMFFSVLSFSIINYSIQIYTSFIANRLIKRLRDEVIEKSIKTKIQYYQKSGPGDIVNHILTESSGAAGAYQQAILHGSFIIQAVIFIIGAFITSPDISIVAVIVGLFVASIFFPLIKKTEILGIKYRNFTKDITLQISDYYLNIRSFKAMNIEKLIKPIILNLTRKLEVTAFKLSIVKGILTHFRLPLVVFFVSGLIIFSLLNNILTIIEIIPFILIFERLNSAIGKAQNTFQAFVKVEPFYDSYKIALNEMENEKEEKDSINKIYNFNKIEFKDVSFSYNDKKKVLDNFSLEINKGEIVLIYGPSGSGKSTFLDLLICFNRPELGEIFVDGKRLIDLDLSSWRSLIGYMPQNLFLLNDTIKHNITLGDTAYSNKDLDYALKISNSYSFIKQLPLKEDTLPGNTDSVISGGERQRIIFARSLVKKPKILILDEPTSSIDIKNSRDILLQLKELSKVGTTIIIVSHEKELMNYADRVVRI